MMKAHCYFFFLKGTELTKTSQNFRALPIAAAAGDVVLFGTSIIFGAVGNCGVLSIFGSRREKAQTNAKNVRKLGECATAF